MSDPLQVNNRVSHPRSQSLNPQNPMLFTAKCFVACCIEKLYVTHLLHTRFDVLQGRHTVEQLTPVASVLPELSDA